MRLLFPLSKPLDPDLDFLAFHFEDAVQGQDADAQCDAERPPDADMANVLVSVPDHAEHR